MQVRRPVLVYLVVTVFAFHDENEALRCAFHENFTAVVDLRETASTSRFGLAVNWETAITDGSHSAQ